MANVLVVDDERSLRVTLGMFLEGAGHTVLLAGHVEEAIRHLESAPVDIVVTDLLMPGRTGLDLLRHVRESGSRIPVILITGEPSLNTVSEAIRNKAFAYLEKPVPKERILLEVAGAAAEKARDDEHHRLQEETRRHREDLERRVEERTAQLRESEARYREMADLLPQAIFEADADGRLTYANRQAFVLFGATPEDLAKKPSVLDYLAPEDRERGWRNVVRRLEGDTTVDTAYTAVRRDGTRFPVLILSALMSRDGRATGLRGVIVDMTEQRQAEDELRRASDEWEQTFNATPDLIAIVDREYRIVRANRAMIATFGNGTGSLFGHKCYAVVHGTGAPPASCPHAALLRDGQEHVAEITVARLNRTFSVSASPLRDANGRIWGSVRVARDITERKEIEDAVRRAERRYRDLFEKAPVMYAITRNENGVPVVEDCNDVFLETLGRRREDVVGRSLGEFYTADSLRMMEAGGYRRALNGGFGVEERELLAGDGRSVPVLTTADPRRGDDGRVVGTVAAFLDVSELKRAEEELRRMRGDLCRLDRSARMGEMAAALAHELNPPLTGILSNAQAAQRSLAMKKPDLDEVRSILAGIVADDQRAGEVIRRLRTFLRRDPPEREPVAVNALVLDLLKIVRTDPELRHVTLTTELCDSLPLVRADGVQVQEVILNLVLNAEQAMADGPAVARQIVVSTAPCETGGVLVTVRDRGPGFSPDRIGAPFEPFRSTQSDGMGLGLSICRAIVESHGGRIWAENRPEGGARVSFSLPAAG